jgi:OOP family OmpA-OmpF porin
MTNNLLVLAVCFTAFIYRASAQEMGIGLDGGLQGLHYPLQNGDAKLLPGASLNLNYTFNFHSQWALLTGIGGGLYRTQATLHDGQTYAYDEVDDAGSAFVYNVKLTGYKETQRTFMASIPLLLQYHTDDAHLQWYFNGGVKLFLPLNTNTQISAQQLSLSGYYPNYDIQITDLPQHGFGTLDPWKSNATTQLKASAALSAGTGVSFSLSPGSRLYVGVYLDYGLTNLKSKTDSLPIVSYSPTGIENVKATGLLNMPNTGQVKLLSFGLQVRLTFGSKPAKHGARPKKPIDTTGQTTTALSDSELAILRTPVVFGSVGTVDIPESQLTNLDEVVTILQQHPTLRISIVGYACDDVKEKEGNKVGGARAKAVMKYLETKGIDHHRMDIYYDSEPSVSYDPSANYQNRRALIDVE